MTEPMTLAEYARRVRTNYHTLYARVERRINQGKTDGLLLRVEGRMMPMPANVWDAMTVALPPGRPRKNPPRTKKRRIK